MQYATPTFAPSTARSLTSSNPVETPFKLGRQNAPLGALSPEEQVSTPLPPGPLLVASRRPSERQLKDLSDVMWFASSINPSPEDVRNVKEIYRRWQIPDNDLRILEQTAKNVATDYMRRHGNAAHDHASNWFSYSLDQKKRVISDFIGSMNASIGQSFNVGIGSIPQNSQNTIPLAYYIPGENKIVLNLHRSVNHSFGQLISSAMHEGFHGKFFNAAKGISFDTLYNEIKAGRIPLTLGMTAANISINAYFTAQEHGFNTYAEQPTERIAFSGQAIFDRYLNNMGISTPPALPPNHSILQNLRSKGLI